MKPVDNSRGQLDPNRQCNKCQHMKKEAMQVGPNQHAMMMLCGNPFCQDPVTGDQAPCNVARQTLIMCGFDGRYFEKAEEPVKAPVIELVKSRSSQARPTAEEADKSST